MTPPGTDSSPPASPPTAEAARFQRVMDIFLLAVDLDQAGRDDLVRRECASDPSIAADVLAMLAAEPPKDASRATDPASSLPSTDPAASADLATGAGLRLGADAAMAELRDLERDAAAALRTLPIISGHYRIIRTLGEGGMGVVYLAEQSMPKRLVALKAIRAGLASRSVLTRFVREANILGRLQHPGIAQIYECGVLEEDDSGRAFIVLEYVDGPTITRYALDHIPDEAARLALVADACDAVQHAHQRGVIHRDLKPANILVELQPQAGRPKVLDFGVAHLDQDAHAQGTSGASLAHALVGTPGYMSPEQLDSNSGAVDATSDVYALGVILYEVLSGKKAFDVAGKPLAEAARLVRTTTPPRIESLSRARRTDLETILAKAMHPDRGRRYQSAAALSDDLRAAIDRRPIAARRDSALYVLSRLADRHRIIVSLCLLLLLAGLALVISSTLLAQRNARLAREAQDARLAAESRSSEIQALNNKLSEELSSARIDRGRAESVAGRMRLAEESLWTEALDNPLAPAPKWALAELYQRIPVTWAVQGPTDPTAMCTLASGDSVRIIIARASGSLVVFSDTGQQLFETPTLGSRISALAPLTHNTLLVAFQDGKAALLAPAPDPQPTFLSLPPNSTLFKPDSKPDTKPDPSLLHPRGVREISVSSDARTFTLLGADKSITAWRLAPSTNQPTFLTRFTPHPDSILTQALSPDGQFVVSAGNDTRQTSDQPISILRVTALPASPAQPATSIWSQERQWDDTVLRIAFPEGSVATDTSPSWRNLLLSRRDFRISTFDTATRVENIVPRKLPYITFFAKLQGSQRLLLMSEDMVFLSTVGSQQIDWVCKQESRVFSGAWLSPSRYITLNDAGVLRSACPDPLPALTRIDDFRGWCFSTAWSPDSAHLAIGSTDGFVSIHDSARIARTASILCPQLRIRGLQWLSDSDRLVLGCQDGKVRIASLSTRSILREFVATQSEIYGLAVDPTEKLVVVGQWSPAIRVLNLETGELTQELPKPERRVDDVAFSPDGRVMVCSGYSQRIQAWNTSDWSPAEPLPVTAIPWGVEFSRDSRLLLVSTYDGTVEVFDVDLDRPIGQRFTHRASIRAHQRLIPALAIAPDSSIFATGSEDGAVKIWDAKSLRNLFTTDLESGLVISAAFSPDGHKLAAAAGGRVSAVLDLPSLFIPVEAQREFQTARIRPPSPEKHQSEKNP